MYQGRSLAPVLALVLGLSVCVAAQNQYFSLLKEPSIKKEINQTIVRNTTSIALSQLGEVSGLAASGTVTLRNENSFARIIMVSSRGDEYLVFEVNALLSDEKSITFSNHCEETRELDNVTPSLVRIELENASMYLSSVEAVGASAQSALKSKSAAGKDDALRAQKAQKLLRIRASIKQKGLRWVADETSVSQMSYEEKKGYFGGKVPNLYGFEYYAGGIFQIPSETTRQAGGAASPFTGDFSWRKKHGQNWMTPVRNQGGCGSCWAFGATGATELLTNLYFNRHLDIDLSEQEALSCMGGGSCAGGSPGPVLDYIAAYGIGNESCFPYTAIDQPCANKCSDPVERIKIGGRNSFYNQSEDTLKAMILRSAVSAGISNWWHLLTLAGYRTLKAGDTYYIRGYDGSDYWVTIAPNDTLIGRTVWELKNSWGTWWGDNGYCHVLTALDNIYLTDEIVGPVARNGHSNNEILCTDADGDGYYCWGVGPKPAHCPASPAQPDGDDSDPCKGPMDYYGQCAVLCAPVTANFSVSSGTTCVGRPVVFTDASGGPVGAWKWNFGEGATPATGVGKGPFTVSYTTSGSKTVSLTVTNPRDGSADTETKAGCISVSARCDQARLTVYARDEAYYETNSLKPHIYIANTGTTSIDGFKMVFKIKTSGKTPILEDWYTPYETVKLVNCGNNEYKVEFDYAGYTLRPGGIVPNTTGNAIGLHYGDWSRWDATSDFKPGIHFGITDDVGIYDKHGVLVYGKPQ